MESHRKRHERVHEDRRSRGQNGQRNLESRRRRRSRSNSPRRKERRVSASPERSTSRGRSPRSRASGQSRDVHEHREHPQHRRRDHHHRERDTDHLQRGPREHGDQPRQRGENWSDEQTRRDGTREGEEPSLNHRERERTYPDIHTGSSHHRKRRGGEEEDISQYEFGGATNKEESDKDKDKPDYGLSGKLTAETNTYRGVVIKYNEPEEARIPKTRWRLYGFKGEETLPTLYMHRQSAYLIGRNRKVVDMPVDHPSCSGQHAVLQYRLVEYEKMDGSTGKKVKPYIIDLESTNGTYVNNNRIDAARYYELKEGDMIKFGFSSREYVLLHENSQHEVTTPEEKSNEEGV